MQERVDPQELRRLGRQWEFVRRISPTRPHPTVSRRPPGNALSALPLAVLDRTRDLLDASTAQAVSRGLAGAAGLVERLPLARRGDRPSTSR